MSLRLVLAIAAFTATASPAFQAARAQETHLSRKQLNVLLKTGHTGPQYQELAGYYHAQAERFHSLQRTASEEMEHLLRDHLATKTPSRYDHARNLEMYYRSRWKESAAQATLYTDKVAGSEQPERP